ncbi:hypothetical protein SS50377_20516 [Spironucleus salmonicida]|uniref:Uncharacterized protein n=1 Tax=Spironucleus salmonicida TaxID=348837 RepID=A0A9P8LZH8_9EUKA|nr:hypothetical protein SS50377_20516 [Spironucleus salmonicida]
MPFLVGNLVLFEGRPYYITEFINSRCFYIQNHSERLVKRPKDVRLLALKGPSNYTIQEEDFAAFEKVHKLIAIYEKKLIAKQIKKAEFAETDE